VEVAAATAVRRPYEALVSVNEQPVARARLGGSYRAISFPGLTDDSGVLRIRLHGEASGVESAFRLAWVRVSHESGGFVPAGRWVEYGLLALLWLGVVTWGWGRFTIALASMPALLLIYSVALGAARLHVLVDLPWVLGIGAACAALAGVCSLGAVPRAAARWVVLGFAVRLAFALHPACPSIDSTFHVHRVRAFRDGEVISSGAPGPDAEPLRVPYPPLLYGLLSPVFRWGLPDEELVVRAVMALLEGTAPLLVFALMRSGGSSPGAAGHGAAAAAVMPEGVLVIGKGIAANILGSWVTLLILGALLRGAPAAVTTGLLALGFLSHFGAALSLGGLLVVWLALRVRFRELTPARAAGMLSSMVAAVFLAWLVYYREVFPLIAGSLGSIGRHVKSDASGFLHARWVQVGKTLQDLLLKFGAAPLLLAAVGCRRKDAPPRLKRLLTSWFGCGLGYAALALLTPLPLRFEYFLVPAVAAAAGLGAEEMERRGRRRLVAAALSFAFLLQLALAVLMLAGRFELISVIMESDRWPFPVH